MYWLRNMSGCQRGIIALRHMVMLIAIVLCLLFFIHLLLHLAVTCISRVLFLFILIPCFYICSPNCQFTSCSTSESLSPVKQAPRKSPSDTEGLVKSLPSGSHQVMADCPSACGAVLCSLVLGPFPGCENKHSKGGRG